MACTFQLGDLVLAKFDEYPYWPAVVQKCFWRGPLHYGRWRLVDPAGNTTKLWCSFVEDDTANWVPLKKVKTFTPKAARRWQCRRRTRNYEAQQKAIEAAENLYARRYSIGDEEAAPVSNDPESSVAGTTGTRSASPSSFGSYDRVRSLGEQICSDTSGNIIMSEFKDAPVAATLGTGRKRQRPRNEVTARSSKEVKRKKPLTQSSMTRKADAVSREGSDEHEKKLVGAHTGKPSNTFSSKKVRIKEEWIQEYKQSRAFAKTMRHVSTSGPYALKSKQMPSDEFISVMQHLRHKYLSLKNSLEDCNILRERLQARIAENSRVDKRLDDDLGIQESNTSRDLGEMLKLLERLLEADIALDDLRKLRAGKLITSIMKNCSEIFHIEFLCSKIVEIWREQCRVYDEQAVASK